MTFQRRRVPFVLPKSRGEKASPLIKVFHIYFAFRGRSSLCTQVIALVNQKGSVGKSTTCANLGLGHSQSDTLPITLSDPTGKVLNDQPITPSEGILHCLENVDLILSNTRLSGMKMSLVSAMSRENILRQYLDTV